MSWASERRLIVWAIIGAILLVCAALLYMAVLYRAPTCTDGIQDGKESGLDCGGTCPYLCSADEEDPNVLFSVPVLNGEGRTDVIALIENKNVGVAAKGVAYDINVFGYDQSLIQHVTGTIDLPPGATVPVFVPGIASGKATPSAAFLTLDASSTKWYALPKDPRILPKVGEAVITGATSTPRITATLSNPDVRAMRNVKVIVIVKDGEGNAIAASQTVLKAIPAQGSATATFTWNAPFTGTPVSVQVLPVIPLPAAAP